jgi:hypothetical protein
LADLAQQAATGMDPRAATALQDQCATRPSSARELPQSTRSPTRVSKLQAMERKAFGLDDDSGDAPNSYEDNLRALAEGV